MGAWFVNELDSDIRSKIFTFSEDFRMYRYEKYLLPIFQFFFSQFTGHIVLGMPKKWNLQKNNVNDCFFMLLFLDSAVMKQ